jgi:hypothetical protein
MLVNYIEYIRWDICRISEYHVGITGNEKQTQWRMMGLQLQIPTT